MVKYQIILARQAAKDAKNLASAKLKTKADKLLQIIANNPFDIYPPYEKLNGEMQDMYSRRINKQHRLVYTVHEKERIVHVLRMLTHYE